MRVTIVATNVMNESTKGNIGFVVIHVPRDCSKVAGMDIILDIINTIRSIIILPINPAIRAQRELSHISCMLIDFGQKDMREII